MGILVDKAWRQLKPRDIAKFDYRTQLINLPKRQCHADFMKTGGKEYGLDEQKAQGFVEQLVPGETRSTSLQIGNLLMIGAPAEMASGLGLAAKARARQLGAAECISIAGLADEWVS